MKEPALLITGVAAIVGVAVNQLPPEIADSEYIGELSVIVTACICGYVRQQVVPLAKLLDSEYVQQLVEQLRK